MTNHMILLETWLEFWTLESAPFPFPSPPPPEIPKVGPHGLGSTLLLCKWSLGHYKWRHCCITKSDGLPNHSSLKIFYTTSFCGELTTDRNWVFGTHPFNGVMITLTTMLYFNLHTPTKPTNIFVHYGVFHTNRSVAKAYNRQTISRPNIG